MFHLNLTRVIVKKVMDSKIKKIIRETLEEFIKNDMMGNDFIINPEMNLGVETPFNPEPDGIE